jgi:hypothetical protein
MQTCDLDAILALQLAVAWAGERGNPRQPRLGWWEIDMIDAAGGGDFLARLLPKTHAWAGLELTREAARQVDQRARRRHANPDAMRSLFFLGAKLDGRLAERFVELKRTHCDDWTSPVPLPRHVLPGLSACMRGAVLDQEALCAQLATEHGYPGFDVVAGGRRLRGERPRSAVLGVRHLARALFTAPVPAAYPLAFYALPTSARVQECRP